MIPESSSFSPRLARILLRRGGDFSLCGRGGSFRQMAGDAPPAFEAAQRRRFRKASFLGQRTTRVKNAAVEGTIPYKREAPCSAARGQSVSFSRLWMLWRQHVFNSIPYAVSQFMPSLFHSKSFTFSTLETT